MVTNPLNARLADEAPGRSRAAPRAALAGQGDGPYRRSQPGWRVTFHLTGMPSGSVALDVWRVTVLGRADPMSAFRPDLDYSRFGAMRYGVSRRHALVRPNGDSLYIVDQNSTNGTWVNGQRLTPGQSFPLADGDVIELGALRMTLRIDETPAHEGEPDGLDHGLRGFGFRFLGRD